MQKLEIIFLLRFYSIFWLLGTVFSGNRVGFIIYTLRCLNMSLI